MVKIASFNVENLFAPPRAFNSANWSVGKPMLDAYRDVNALIKKVIYSATDKAKIRDLLVKLDIYTINAHGAVRRKDTLSPKWAWLRKNRGTFDREPQDATQSVEIIANGRGDWIGWIELATEPTSEIGTRMTARVIQDVGAKFDETHVRNVTADVRQLIESRGHRVRRVDIPEPGKHPHSSVMGLLLLAMSSFGLFALLLSGILVVNLLTALMAAQIRQIGVMKSLGGTRRQIAGIYFGQALLLGVAALLVAMPVGLWSSLFDTMKYDLGLQPVAGRSSRPLAETLQAMQEPIDRHIFGKFVLTV